MKSVLRVILVISFLKPSCIGSKSFRKCPRVPELTIIITPFNGTEVRQFYNAAEVSISEPSSVEIQCISSEPVYMDVKGEMATRFEDIVTTRIIKYENSTSRRGDYYQCCFEAVLKFESKTSATGNYTCQTVALKTKNVVSAVYIFADTGDSSDGHLLNAGHSISTGRNVPDNFLLIIPCVVTKASSQPKLYRSDLFNWEHIEQNEGKEENSFPYDPRKGFIINIRNASDCWTDFVCLLGNERLVIRTIKPKEFRSSPPVQIVNSQRYSRQYWYAPLYNTSFRITFVCESREKNTFTHTIKDEQKDIRMKHTIHPENYYAYKTVFQYFGNVNYSANTSTVSCVQAENHNNVYRNWTIVHLGINETKSGIFYDSNQKSFYCYSPTAQPTTFNLRLISCDNPLECHIAERFIDQNETDIVNLPFEVSDVGYSCRHKYSTIYTACKEFPIQIGTHYGMVNCQTGNYHFFSIYYTDLFGKIVTRFYRDDPSSAIFLQKINRTVYVNETVTVTCKVSALQFSAGIKFFANVCPGQNYSEICNIYENDFPRNATMRVKEDVTKGVITLAVTLQIWNNRIKGFVFDVPVLYSKLSITTFAEISVKDGEYPEIQSEKNFLLLRKRYENENKTLICIATGEPLPKITWERGDIQITHVTKAENNKRVSTIYFTKNMPAIPGEYSCIATNVKGFTRKIFTVEIDNDTFSSFTYFSIAGAVAALFLILVLILIGMMRKQKTKYREMKEIIEWFDGTNEKVTQDDNSVAESNYLQIAFNPIYEIQKNTFLIDRRKLLGKGEFGEVYKGLLDGTEGAVAFKTVPKNSSVENFKALVSELKLLIYLGAHENLVTLLGAYRQEISEGVLIIALELCDLGSLESYLRSHKHLFLQPMAPVKCNKYQNIKSSSEVDSLNLHSKLTLLNWCSQIATGMEYLGTKNVVHTDLASRNVLLTAEANAKITDFGLSRRMYTASEYKKTGKDPLPWKWLAVECLLTNTFSAKSDVWAYGITMWEIFSLGETPYPGISPSQEFVHQVENGLRNLKPKYSSYELYHLMNLCWASDPNDRPTFTTLRMIFQNAIFESKDNIDINITEGSNLHDEAIDMASSNYTALSE